jgi:steroid delta-isomerase-like uncharacterized protein
MVWTEIHIGLYVEGKLVEHWGNINTLAIMQQMGAIPGWYEKPPVPPRPVVNGKVNTTFHENAAMVRRFVHDVWNKGNMETADALIHPQSIDPSYTEYPVGPAGAKLAVQLFHNAFPDLYMFIHDIIAEEDVVAIRFTMAGTHEGVFMDMPPTGKIVEVGGCSIFHFGDGQIIERWQEFDMLGLLGQLGMGA